MATRVPFPSDFDQLPRENAKYYICSTEKERSDMLKDLDKQSLDHLFTHIPDEVKFKTEMNLGKGLEREELADHLFAISNKNKNTTKSFLGDALQVYNVPDIVEKVCSLRGLTTAYTPYQPERSQGTLNSLWVYSSAISMLTGFEAVNASMYERSTCLYEAINCALRCKRNKNSVIISEGLYPQDREVLETLQEATNLNIITSPLNANTGLTDIDELIKLINDNHADLAAMVFPQVNQYGLLENVDLFCDIASEKELMSIATFDPMLLGKGGLKKPADFGTNKQGADIIIGEGQHLCLGANFGGPGLGIFAVRYNEKNKTLIRNTPGRFIGKAKDSEGRDCKVMVLSTREQHIRRERATSNICSNQSFLATICGAALLSRGDKGMEQSLCASFDKANRLFQKITQIEGIKAAFPMGPFFNEIVLELEVSSQMIVDKAAAAGIHIGHVMNERIHRQGEFLKICFNDTQSEDDINALIQFLENEFNSTQKARSIPCPPVPSNYLREDAPGIATIETAELFKFYQTLSDQNLSPDDNIYPLGSCTMKYNPHINDWAASLPGFTMAHPQAPVSDVQGCLEILFETQEIFKKITGLAAVTTQPVAGAQGELVGVKMFQAYHADKGELEQRDVILIPRSAHGTNPATATMAGFGQNKTHPDSGIVLIEANEKGEIDFDHFLSLVEKYGRRISSMMVTNPNTAGIFESRFHEMAKMLHDLDALVYMDGANMNAIAGHIDLNALGVDAVHNNLHKTWTIPHGGGGPGDAIVAVSERLVDYLPGIQVVKENNQFDIVRPKKSMGSIHRHYGNFAHKVRAYTYLKALGEEGVKMMSSVATLNACYLFHHLKNFAPSLPVQAKEHPRMHEFILTFSDETFKTLTQAGIPKGAALAKIGKLFLDFGIHAPTVAFPEPLGIMIEPTETYSKAELDKFIETMKAIYRLIEEHPEVLNSAPHFTPVRKIDEVSANKNLVLFEKLDSLPKVFTDKIKAKDLGELPVDSVLKKIVQEHELQVQ